MVGYGLLYYWQITPLYDFKGNIQLEVEKNSPQDNYAGFHLYQNSSLFKSKDFSYPKCKHDVMTCWDTKWSLLPGLWDPVLAMFIKGGLIFMQSFCRP